MCEPRFHKECWALQASTSEAVESPQQWQWVLHQPHCFMGEDSILLNHKWEVFMTAQSGRTPPPSFRKQGKVLNLLLRTLIKHWMNRQESGLPLLLFLTLQYDQLILSCAKPSHALCISYQAQNQSWKRIFLPSFLVHSINSVFETFKSFTTEEQLPPIFCLLFLFRTWAGSWSGYKHLIKRCGLCPKSSDRGVAKTVYKLGRHSANSCAPSEQSRSVRHSRFHMQTCYLQSSFSARWEFWGFLHCVGTSDALSIWEEMKTI